MVSGAGYGGGIPPEDLLATVPAEEVGYGGAVGPGQHCEGGGGWVGGGGRVRVVVAHSRNKQ
jgi:hypothetical protein